MASWNGAVLNLRGAFPGERKKTWEQVLGEHLPDSLRRSGLLPRHMLPLVQAAERAQNLPWALTELGDFLADGAVGRMRRLSQLLFPVSVVAIGLLVGFTALAIFSPVVEVMTELSG